MGFRSFKRTSNPIAEAFTTVSTTVPTPLSPTTLFCRKVTIVSDNGGSANTNNASAIIALGSANITTASPGLRKGCSITFGPGPISKSIDLNKVYGICATSNQVLMWWAEG